MVRTQSIAQPRQVTAPWWNRRSAVLLVSLVLFLGIVLRYAGVTWIIALERLLTDGVLVVAWLLAAGGVGAPVLRALRVRWGERDRMLVAVTSAALGLGVLSLAMLGLGLAGWLGRGLVWAMVGLGWLLLAIELWRARATLRELRVDAWLNEPAGWGWLWVVPVAFGALATEAAMVPPGMLWAASDPAGYDAVEYHLQVPREWYELGRIVPLHHNIFSFMPFNVEMQFLAAMYLKGGPWAGMYLAQLMHVGYCLLGVLAVWGVVRSLGSSGKAGAMLAAVAAGTAPWVAMLASVAYCEGGVLLYGALALGWTMKWMSGEGEQRDSGHGQMLLAGLMAGFACGTKLTAVPMLLVGIPAALAGVWAIACLRKAIPSGALPSSSLWRRVLGRARLRRAAALPADRRAARQEPRPPSFPPGGGSYAIRSYIAGIGLFVVAGMLVFSPWLVRNWTWTGNPIFPEQMERLGAGHYDPVQVERYRLAHHMPESKHSASVGRILAVWDQIVSDWRYSFVLLPLAVVAVVVCRRDDRAIFLGLVLLLVLGFWVSLTHLQSRFFVLLVPIAALLIGQMPWQRWAGIGAAVLVLAAALGWGLTQRDLVAKGSMLLPDGVNLLEAMLPPEALDRVRAGHHLLLVGDAKAFWYTLPSSRLHYRTIFDVGSSAPSSVVQSWAGGAQVVVPKDWVIWIDVPEIRRFARTYWQAPDVPAEWRDRDRFMLEP